MTEHDAQLLLQDFQEMDTRIIRQFEGIRGSLVETFSSVANHSQQAHKNVRDVTNMLEESLRHDYDITLDLWTSIPVTARRNAKLLPHPASPPNTPRPAPAPLSENDALLATADLRRYLRKRHFIFDDLTTSLRRTCLEACRSWVIAQSALVDEVTWNIEKTTERREGARRIASSK
jgi:hypothetical protein